MRALHPSSLTCVLLVDEERVRYGLLNVMMAGRDTVRHLSVPSLSLKLNKIYCRLLVFSHS